MLFVPLNHLRTEARHQCSSRRERGAGPTRPGEAGYRHHAAGVPMHANRFRRSRITRPRKGTIMIVTSFRRHAAVCTFGAAVVAALTVTVAPAAYADDAWGSCAVPSNPKLVGNAVCIGNSFPDQTAAESRATEMCNYLKDRQCYVVVSFTDCGAIAQNGDRWTGGSGPTQQAAEQAATGQLPGSRVAKSVCVAQG